MKSIRWGNWLKAFALVAFAYFVTMYVFINRFIMFSEVSIFNGSTGRSFIYYPPSQFFAEGMVFPAILIVGSGLWIILSLTASPRPIWPQILFVVGLVISFPALYFGELGGMDVQRSYERRSLQVEDHIYRVIETERRGHHTHLLECDSIGLRCQVVLRSPDRPSPVAVLRYEPSSRQIELLLSPNNVLRYSIDTPP
jgi:hypothetical protein